MSKRIATPSLSIVAIAVALPSLAAAWTPYGYGPGSRPQYPLEGEPAASGAPTSGTIEQPPGSGATPPYPGRGPAYPSGSFYPGFRTDFPSEPYGGSFGPPPGFPPPGAPFGRPGPDQPGFGTPSAPPPISRYATQDAYILEVPLIGGMKPEQVQIDTQGRWIIVSRDQSAQQAREETFDEGRGYMRSYSFSSGTGSRRFTLPPDADLAAMKREDGKDEVRIVIPRRTK